jgi:hypothetical protein
MSLNQAQRRLEQARDRGLSSIPPRAETPLNPTTPKDGAPGACDPDMEPRTLE